MMKKIIFSMLIFMSLFMVYRMHAQVGINNDGSSPEASAMLDVKSTTKGMLTPRMTETERLSISSPATGLIVFQTDGNIGFYYYGGSGWEKMADYSEKNTLDQAYDQGGAGAGKSIIADNGAVRVDGTDGFLVTGSINSGQSFDNENAGNGPQMFFYPRKAAFRAGYVNGIHWNDVNIGYYSIAMGNNTIASGLNSTALGNNTMASFMDATAMGYSTFASGFSSTAMGNHTTASGHSSTAIGKNTTASGKNAIAMGEYATASAQNAVSIGKYTTASGIWSTAMGYNSTASGYLSIAMGSDVTAPSYAETAVGRNNTDYTPADISHWNSSDRLFVIGNGQGSLSQHNALTIYKDGRMNINDEYFMPQTDGTAGQIMQTDGSGQVSFADAPVSAAGSIDTHSDVDVSANPPATGQVLGWDGNNWVPANDHNTTYSAGTGLDLSGTVFSLNSGIDNLTDVNVSTNPPATGQVLGWNGNNWVPADKFSGNYDDLTNTPVTFLKPNGSLPDNINDNMYHSGNIAIGTSTVNSDTKITVQQTGNSTGNYIGVKSIVSTNSGSGLINQYGYYSKPEGGNTGLNFGIYNDMSGTGIGPQYGVYNLMYGNRTGEQYGVMNDINIDNNFKQYGTYNVLFGSGTGNKYGTYNKISSTAGGTHYAVYGEAEKTGSYAGYFKGEVTTSKDYNYVTPKTYKFNTLGIDFRVSKASETDVYYNKYYNGSIRFVANNVLGGFATIVKGVHLPDGAVITKITLYASGHVEDQNYIVFYFEEKNLNTGVATTATSNVFINISNYQAYTTIPSPPIVIDNDKSYFIYMRFSGSDDGDAINMHNVTIEYTMDKVSH